MSRTICPGGKTHYEWFGSRTIAGVPSTLNGSPVVSIYSGLGGLTQFTTGVTLTVDYDGVTGLNRLAIDTTDSTAYTLDEDFDPVITTGTVNSVSAIGPIGRPFNTRIRNLGMVQAGIPTAGSGVSKVIMPAGRIAGISVGDQVWVEGGQKRPVNTITTTNNANDTLNFTTALPADPTAGFVRIIAAAQSDPASPIPADVKQWLATAVTANTGGVPVVDVGRVGNTAQTAGDLAALLGTAQTDITTIKGYTDTEVAAILAAVGDGTYGLSAIRTLLNTIAGYIDTEVAAIKAKTDNLPASPANEVTLATVATYVDTEVAAIKAKTDNLPASPANEATLATIAGYIDTEVAAIKAKTDNLPASPANEVTLATVATYVDTEVAAIKAKTDNLPSDPADASDLAAAIGGLVAATITAMDTRDGIITGAVAADAGNSATTFKVDTDVGTDVRFGMLRLSSGTIAGESRLVYWTGTQITVFGHPTMPVAGKRYSGTPANGVTFRFRPGA